jgi:hypothetical protein
MLLSAAFVAFDDVMRVVECNAGLVPGSLAQLHQAGFYNKELPQSPPEVLAGESAPALDEGKFSELESRWVTASRLGAHCDRYLYILASLCGGVC